MQRSKYIKLAKIVVVQVLDVMKDERCFSTLSFMKNKLRNQLTTHLDVIIHVFAQRFYILESFPYYQIIKEWKLPIVNMQLMLNCFDIGE
jgi:hypothetical protein